MTHFAAATAHGRGRRLALLALVTLGLLCAAFSASAYAATDYDGDGAADNDCAPLDPAVYPGAADKPDLAFEDTNCDGIDGTAASAVFVATGGSDAATGTKGNPLQTINAAITKASAEGKDVYVAGGTYNEILALADNVGVYGRYAPFSGARSNAETTTVNGSPQAALADGDTAVTLQSLTLSGSALGGAGQSAYGVRAINGSSVVLEGVRAEAGNGTTGVQPGAVAPPAPGNDGFTGTPGTCGSSGRKAGGSGGALAIAGGPGGASGYSFIQTGLDGTGGTPSGTSPGGVGGSGGTANGAVGGPGSKGGNGVIGTVPGAAGSSPDFTTANAGATWSGAAGGSGGVGQNGAGGAGGGGGASGWGTDPSLDAHGGGGGGGGGGGLGGTGGTGGGPGGGSFAVYAFDSSVVVTASQLVAANGGGGGNGVTGSNGSAGGQGAPGASGVTCAGVSGGKGGNGGNGGTGAPGGPGGGGTGGPSVALMTAGTGSYVLRSTQTTTGSAGSGGSRGGGGTPAGSGAVAASSGAESTTADADGDGVPDPSDACPGVPKGTSDADGDGCPDRAAKLADANGNGIPDSQESQPAAAPLAVSNTNITTTTTAPPPAAPAAIKGAVVAKGSATATKITFKKLMLGGIPVGASIKVTCKAKSRRACPSKSKALTSKAATVNVLAALLKKPARTVVFAPGAVLTIRITKSGMTGTSFVFKMVKKKFPKPKRV